MSSFKPLRLLNFGSFHFWLNGVNATAARSASWVMGRKELHESQWPGTKVTVWSPLGVGVRWTGDFLGLKRYLGSYTGVLGGGVILFGRSGYEEISPFFGGDRDKPVILEPRRRTRASLFQLQSRTCQERGLQRLWEERLSVGHPLAAGGEFSACWDQGLQKPGCSGHPPGRWRDPGCLCDTLRNPLATHHQLGGAFRSWE